jgi:carboxylesterase type B
MSSPVFSFSQPNEAQDKFDRLIDRIGVSASASGVEKIDALRRLTEKQMIDLVEGEVLIRPVWDRKWFGHEQDITRLDQVIEYPKWIQGLVMGWVKDETALGLPLWNKWSREKLLDGISYAATDSQMAHDIRDAYGLSHVSRENVLRGVLDFSADALYVVMPLLLARKLKPPVSLYRFDQVDTWNSSVFRNYAYHCLDLAYLFRLPSVTSSKASKATQDLTDNISKMITEFVHGRQPWEPFNTISEKIMVFKGSESKLCDWIEDDEKSKTFMDNPAMQDLFVNAGYRLVTYTG